MKLLKTNMRKFKIHSLKLNPFLKLYGVHNISQFEFKQLDRFDIPPGQVIATENGVVLANWEEVEQAKRRNYKEIEVCVIEGLDEDDIPQVVSFKNIQKKKSRYHTAELITLLREYLEENPSGKVWKDDIPGENVIKKIAFLLDYSYGMTSTILKIYRKNPDLLKLIDDGEMTFTEADKICSSLKDSDNDAPDSQSGEDKDKTTDDPGFDEDQNEEPDGIAPEPVNPPKPEGPWRYAGENRMVPCEPVQRIQIIYSSGKTLELEMGNNSVSGTIFGNQIADLRYNGGKFLPDDNSEFHCLTTKNDKAGMELIFWNINDMAA